MTERGATHGSASAFATARRAWLQARVTELSEELSELGPQLHALAPFDLGDQRLVNALVLTRVAADEARVQPVSESVAWLKLLIPNGHRYDLGGAVREIRSALTAAEDPALWSWNAQGWEELVLALWRRDRALRVKPSQADDELISRWGMRTAATADVHHPERAPEQYGLSLSSLAGHLASGPEPLNLLGQAILSRPEVVEAIEDSLAVYEEVLQNAGHLEFLAEQQLCAERLGEWCEKHASGASKATGAFLEELYTSADENYLNEVVDPVIDALSDCEHALYQTAAFAAPRATHEYLAEFLDCVSGPSACAPAEGALEDGVRREAGERAARGELTWHGMRGSVPVWYHIVTSPQERAAALAFSGAATSSAIRIHADVVGPQQFDLFDLDWPDAPDGPEEWYPEPGIALRYSRHSAADLCELLALSALGHARLEFLAQGADGDFVLLRSLRAEVRPGDAADWARGALTHLRTLVPDVGDLADVIAHEEEEDDGPGSDTDEWGRPDRSDGPSDGPPDGGEDSTHQDSARTTGTHGSGGPAAPPPPVGGPLPPHLLARVKAILRQAEDPGATSEESEAFLQKATELMAKYGIEQAMLHGDDPVSEQPADRVVEVTAPWMRECKRLLSSIARELRCQAVYPGGKAHRHRVHLFGFESDLHAVDVLYASLRLQMLRGAEAADAAHRPAQEDRRAYKRSWMLGFIRAVTWRIGEAARVAREESERDRQSDAADAAQGRSVALVLADRTTAVDARLKSRYPKLGKARRTRFTGSGYRQGHADGEQADIGGLSLEDEGEIEGELSA
ncbi:DUF2786 domain-containing protein [Streptomyces sp. NPDC021098]|uniref:DUF2786 domain-containing protein n=1 Tax=unclassified Streptomyces TaxID=2593676 RepID=UPI00378E1597